MDTRFWGPDGWKLFHSIAASYPDKPSKRDQKLYRDFFSSVEHVLPCIYCRNSFHQYSRELPVDGYLESRDSLSYWLFKMHGKVNDKLSGQGLAVNVNRNFRQVHAFYQEYVERLVQSKCRDLPGWDIIYCILFNYPPAKKTVEPERQQGYLTFFYTLAQIMPFPTFRKALQAQLKMSPLEDRMNKRSLKSWVYSLERRFCDQMSLQCPNFKDRCYSIELFKAGCNGKNDPRPTCHI